METGNIYSSVDVASAMPTATGRSEWLLLASLYSTQYLGLNFFVIALVAILRAEGAGLETLGLVYLLGLVWPLKLFWAPLIDRIRFPRFGHYRGWLLLTQSLLVATLLAIGQFSVVDDFAIVYALCFAVALIASTQDIAVDGLACRLLRPEQRGLGNGLQVAGGLIGNLLGGGLMLMMFPHIGWAGCMAALAGLTAISLFQLIVFHEPSWPETTARTARGLYRRAYDFWRKPGRGPWLILLILVPAASGMAYSVVTPLLVDRGWGPGELGLTINVFGSIAGLAAALATGWWIGKTTRRNALLQGVVVQIGAALSILPLVLGLGGDGIAIISVISYFLLYNPAAAVMSTLMMDRAAVESPATDFTLQFSIYQFAAIAAMALGAYLAGALGYAGLGFAATAAAVLAAFLAWIFRTDTTGTSA